MGIGFVILIYFFILFILSLICAVIGGAITYFASREGKSRNTILMIIAPFVGFYTFFICGFIGMSIVADKKKVDVGIGDAWYVPLKNEHQLLFIDIPEQASIAKENGELLVSEISEIEENGSQIFGKMFDGQYFSYDTKTSEVKEFSSEKELSTSLGNKKLQLTDAYDFYSARKSKIMSSWPIWIGILSFMGSVGAVSLLKQVVFKLVRKREVGK